MATAHTSALRSDQLLAAAALRAGSSLRRRRLAGNNRSYQRFVILAHQRSGSTLLTASLNRQPNIVCFSEAFNEGEAQLHVRGLPARSTVVRRLRERAPQAYLDRVIYAGYSPEIEAVGFKVMTDHLDQPGSGSVLRALIDDPNVAMISITRRNKLAAALSLHNALDTGVWHVPASREAPRARTAHLDPEFCERTMSKFAEQQEDSRRLLAGRPHLALHYEDLVASFEEQFSFVQRHIGIEPRALPPASKRLQTLPLPEAIENFEALRQHFAGTKWEDHFSTTE